MVSTHFFHSALNSLTTALIVIDTEHEIQYLNPAAEMLIEASDHQAIGLHIQKFIVDDDNASERMINAIRQEHAYTKRDSILMTHHHQEQKIDYSVAPFSYDNSEHNNALLIEIYPRDRLLKFTREEQQVSHHETSRVLVRGLAHEIKNPLGGIRGAAQLLERELTSDDLKECTQIIIQEADRLRNLVDRMLGSNKLPKIEEVNIHQVLEHVKHIVDLEQLDNIHITRNYDPSIPDFYADDEQLIQAILNVVRNAAQAIENHTSTKPNYKGVIELKTRIIRQFTIGSQLFKLVCKLDIIDNGGGIPKEIKDHIFYPMISGRSEGSGLGLSIAQNIINQLHGLIECNSKPGKTVFTFLIPIDSGLEKGPDHE